MKDLDSAMDFLSITDKKYAPLVNLNSRLIRHFSPDSKYFVYDLDGSSETAGLGSNSNVTLIPWGRERWHQFDWIEEIRFPDVAPNFGLKQEYQRINRSIRVFFGKKPKHDWITNKAAYAEARKRFARVNSQKPFCIFHALSMSRRSLIFLDADALLWNKPDFPLQDVDAMVTVRRKAEISFGHNTIFRQNRPLPFLAINAGVIGFANTEGARKLIYEWIAKLGQIRCIFTEQTALSLLLHSSDPDIFLKGGKIFVLPLLDGSSAKVSIAPCEKYNNFYLDGMSLPSEQTTVAHFKGYLHGASLIPRIEALTKNRLTGLVDR